MVISRELGHEREQITTVLSGALILVEPEQDWSAAKDRFVSASGDPRARCVDASDGHARSRRTGC